RTRGLERQELGIQLAVDLDVADRFLRQRGCRENGADCQCDCALVVHSPCPSVSFLYTEQRSLKRNSFGARYKCALAAVNDVSRKCVARATLLQCRSQRAREMNTASKSFAQCSDWSRNKAGSMMVMGTPAKGPSSRRLAGMKPRS